MRRITFQVTAEGIQFAQQRHQGKCAVVHSLGETIEDVVHPRVNQDYISFSRRDEGWRYTFRTPSRVAEFIDGFDRDRQDVEPFSFTLDLDSPLRARPMKLTTAKDRLTRTGIRNPGTGTKTSQRILRSRQGAA